MRNLQAEVLLHCQAVPVSWTDPFLQAGQVRQGHTLVADDLAEEEVLRLDGRGALLQRVDLGISDVLLDRVILKEA